MAKFRFGVKGVPDKFTIFVLVSFAALGVSALLDFSTAAMGLNLEYLLMYDLGKALAAITLIFTVRFLLRVLVKNILYESLRGGKVANLLVEPRKIMKYAVAEVISMTIFVVLAGALVYLAIFMAKILPETVTAQALAMMSLATWWWVSPFIAGLVLLVSWAITWYLYEKNR